jgi:hypothetical protein
MTGPRAAWRDFWRAAPGRRFVLRYQRLRGSDRGLFRRVGRWVAGIVLIIIGIIFMPLPGPGFVGVLAGAGLLGGESLRVAGWLDRAELRVRGWLRRRDSRAA